MSRESSTTSRSSPSLLQSATAHPIQWRLCEMLQARSRPSTNRSCGRTSPSSIVTSFHAALRQRHAASRSNMRPRMNWRRRSPRTKPASRFAAASSRRCSKLARSSVEKRRLSIRKTAVPPGSLLLRELDNIAPQAQPSRAAPGVTFDDRVAIGDIAALVVADNIDDGVCTCVTRHLLQLFDAIA